MKITSFTPWQLRTIRALALVEGKKVDESIDEANNRDPRPSPDDFHLRLLADYRDMLAELVIMIEDYAKENGGL